MSSGAVVSIWVPENVKEHLIALAAKEEKTVGSIIKSAAFKTLGIKYVERGFAELPELPGE